MGNPDSIGDLIRTLLATYVDVVPAGLVLGKGDAPRSNVSAVFLKTSAARTLYKDRRPICRSADGIRGYRGKECSPCSDRDGCTSQVLVLSR